MSIRLAATTPATQPAWDSGSAATLLIFFHQSLGFASQQRVNGVIAKRLNGSPTMTLDLDTLMRQMTEQKAKDALLTARSTLERSLRELDQYIVRYRRRRSRIELIEPKGNQLCNAQPTGIGQMQHCPVSDARLRMRVG